MSKNKNKPGSRLKTVLRILVPIFLIIVLANGAGAVLDCSMCHKTVPGNAAIRAIDTIEISDKTCLKCHNPDYPPKPIGYDTHLAHIGKYSSQVDYLKRHPKAASSLDCGTCHMNIGENCRNCHIKNIPHIEPPLGYSCKGCHGQLDKLFQHPTINLKIHSVFGNDTNACKMCHNPDNMASLKLASGDIVSMQESHGLCFQCHSGIYNLWNSGQHYSNMTVPSNAVLMISNGMGRGMGSNIAAIRASLENKWRTENTCINCHNPHNPSELYQVPTVQDMSVHTDIMTMVLYVVIALVIMGVVVAIIIIRKRKIKLSDLKPSKLLLYLKGIKLPKLKLPKISIPISVSVEGPESVSKVEKVEKKSDIKESKKLEKTKELGPVKEPEKADVKEPEKADDVKKEEPVGKPDSHGEAIGIPIDGTVPKPKKKTFLQKYRKDVMFILVICVILGLFYAIFGTFMPMAIVASESMSPNINKGDVVFYTDISRIERIDTYDKKNSVNFEDYGDVILYRPLGQSGITPYVHRAMYYVNKGDDMWPGGAKAPHAGYITKGDNVDTNRQYDQQSSVSNGNPIKREWIVGVARFKIPYIGYIRLMLP